MQEQETEHCVVSAPAWFVYIVRCLDHTYYTGITTDLAKRLTEHNSARRGAKYTRPRRPVVLVYSEPAVSRSAAAKREYHIKKLTPAGKKNLIATLSMDDCPGDKISYNRSSDLC